MPVTFNTILGALKIQNLPEGTCFTTFEELLRALPTFLSVEIPSTITNVVISNIQPLDNQRNAVWFRLDNGGSFLGIYLFVGGAWKQVFPAPQQLFRLYGDSREVPDGYELADVNNSAFTAAQAAFLQNTWHRDPTDTFYDIFDVTYVGF